MLKRTSGIFFTISMAFGLSSPGYAATDVESRAKFFNEWLQAPTENLLNKPVGKKLAGVRNLKTVLPGVMYRAGGPGGQSEMKDLGMQSLCEAGFERAYYLYPQGFTHERTIHCTGPTGKPNIFNYVQVGFFSNENKYQILKDVYDRALDAQTGPVLVHCWNGLHASGEIAAVALRQFCGYNSTQAQNYWMKNQRGAQLVSRIGNFKEFPDLRLTDDLQLILCPKE